MTSKPFTPPKRTPSSKYRNVPTAVDGIRFASKAEAKRYQELKLLVRAGEITDLALQPRYKLGSEAKPICVYVADFSYLDLARGNNRVVEDVKSPATAKNRAFRIKFKMFEAQFGFPITLVGAGL